MKKIISFILTTLGGIALGLFFGVFFSAPPSRAEFNTLEERVGNITKQLDELKKGQKEIINLLIRRK